MLYRISVDCSSCTCKSFTFQCKFNEWKQSISLEDNNSNIEELHYRSGAIEKDDICDTVSVIYVIVYKKKEYRIQRNVVWERDSELYYYSESLDNLWQHTCESIQISMFRTYKYSSTQQSIYSLSSNIQGTLLINHFRTGNSNKNIHKKCFTTVHSLEKGCIHNNLTIVNYWKDLQIIHHTYNLIKDNIQYNGIIHNFNGILNITFTPMILKTSRTQITYQKLDSFDILNIPKPNTKPTPSSSHPKLTTYFRDFSQPIIDAISSAKEEILISMYNIEDRDITQSVIDASKRGVEVRILTSYKMIYKRNSKQLGAYQLILEAGITPLIKLHSINDTERKIRPSMHTKIVCIDNQITFTGSVNWEFNSCHHNEEFMMRLDSNEVSSYYKNMIGSFINNQPINDLPLPLNIAIYDTQYQKINFIQHLCKELNKLKRGDTVYMAMFILTDFELDYSMELKDQLTQKRTISVIEELRRCTERGVCLNIIVERNTNSDSFGQYYENKIVPNRFIDYIQQTWQNTQVWRIQTYRGNNEYAAIHHKFVQFNDTIIFGSANWWSISFESEDDLVIMKDAKVAKEFNEEWYRLISPSFTLNGVPDILEEYETILSVRVEFLDLPLNPVRLTKKQFKSVDDFSIRESYVGEILLNTSQLQLLSKPVKYWYCIESYNTKTKEKQYDYDIIRHKTFRCYKGTDTIHQLSLCDEFDSMIIVI